MTAPSNRVSTCAAIAGHTGIAAQNYPAEVRRQGALSFLAAFWSVLVGFVPPNKRCHESLVNLVDLVGQQGRGAGFKMNLL